jgi:hypothetical protein
MKRSKEKETKDLFLEERLDRVDGWIQEGKIPFSSRVIPINESLSTQQWVLPTEQVIEILRNARSFALTKCECRERYQRCDNPLAVCFIINDEADKYVAEKEALHIPIEKAVEVKIKRGRISTFDISEQGATFNLFYEIAALRSQ